MCLFLLPSKGCGGDQLVILRDLQIARVSAEIPVELSQPVFCHCGEMEQHNTKTQISVDFGVVFIRTADQADFAVVNQETVGLTVQVAGGQ